MTTYEMDDLLAAINATLDGREFTRLGTIEAAWSAWSYAAANGECV
jgi:hypothetical protein